MACYQRALQSNPNYAAPLQFGLLFQEQGRLEEAVASHRRALQFDPGLAMAHNLGAALAEQGKKTRRSSVPGEPCNWPPTLPRPTTAWAKPWPTKAKRTRRSLATAGPCS